MTTTLAPSAGPCSVCHRATRCVAVTIADDPADMTRSALTQRSMTAAVCAACISAAMTPRNHARHGWWEKAES